MNGIFRLANCWTKEITDSNNNNDKDADEDEDKASSKSAQSHDPYHEGASKDADLHREMSNAGYSSSPTTGKINGARDDEEPLVCYNMSGNSGERRYQ